MYLVLFALASILLWALTARRMQRWGVAGPFGLAVLGAVAVIGDVDAFELAIDDDTVEKIVEVILAVLLFADATEIKGGLFGREGRVTARLVLLALPFSLLLTIIVGWLVLPWMSPFLVIVIACVVLPTDFAPAARILRTRRLPERVRRILNVESGYNDGFLAPLFSMSLAIAVIVATIADRPLESIPDEEIEGPALQFLSAFFNAIPATIVAILIGIALGSLVGFLARLARSHDIADAAGIRFVMLLLPLIAYAVATLPLFEANGFVAAFVAGIGYRLTRTRGHADEGIAREELILVEETGVLMANWVWFILGGTALIVFVSGFPWEVLVFVILALTALRIAPVYVSLMGSTVDRPSRLLIGALGPRGTASVVFGLLAYNALPDDEGSMVLAVAVTTVFGSILLHGVIAPLVLRRLFPDRPTAADVAVQ